MQKILDMLSEAVKWLRIGFKLFLIVRHCSIELMLLYAITRAEILQTSGKIVLLDGEDKKRHAREFLRRNFLFQNKNITEINRLIESAWQFKFHKEK